MRTLSFLMRGVIADNAQAIHDAHAVTILRQQIRDAAGALATARRELAVAMAYHAAEARALPLNALIADEMLNAVPVRASASTPPTIAIGIAEKASRLSRIEPKLA